MIKRILQCVRRILAPGKTLEETLYSLSREGWRLARKPWLSEKEAKRLRAINLKLEAIKELINITLEIELYHPALARELVNS